MIRCFVHIDDYPMLVVPVKEDSDGRWDEETEDEELVLPIAPAEEVPPGAGYVKPKLKRQKEQ